MINSWRPNEPRISGASEIFLTDDETEALEQRFGKIDPSVKWVYWSTNARKRRFDALFEMSTFTSTRVFESKKYSNRRALEKKKGEEPDVPDF